MFFGCDEAIWRLIKQSESFVQKCYIKPGWGEMDVGGGSGGLRRERARLAIGVGRSSQAAQDRARTESAAPHGSRRAGEKERKIIGL